MKTLHRHTHTPAHELASIAHYVCGQLLRAKSDCRPPTSAWEACNSSPDYAALTYIERDQVLALARELAGEPL